VSCSCPPFYFPGLEGAAFKSKANTQAIWGIFVLGIVLGPLAIRNANRAEALGVRATFAKVTGWTAAVYHGLWFLIYGTFLIMGLFGAFS
jgi:hypothetical protein